MQNMMIEYWALAVMWFIALPTLFGWIVFDRFAQQRIRQVENGELGRRSAARSRSKSVEIRGV